MGRIDDFKKLHGQDIGSKIYNEIKSNYIISKHAQEQLSSRSDLLVLFDDGRINFGATKRNINNAMDNCILAYFNTDGSVNIALTKYYYFVFAWNEWAEGGYLEPDEKYMYEYLIAIKQALLENGEFPY